MNRFSTALAAVVTIWFWSSPALGEKLIYEPFDYAPGQDLLGLQNTSSGWAAFGNTWLRAAVPGSEANSIDTASGSLTGPSELKDPIGNSLTITDGTITGAADRLAIRSAGTTITSGPIYYSFLLQVDSLLGSNTGIGGVFISLNNTANVATNVNPTVQPGRMYARIDPNDPDPLNPTQFSLGMFTNRAPTSGDDAWVDGLTVGETLFIVGEYNVGTGTSNSTRLWINPDPSTFGAAVAPTETATDTTGAANGGTIGSLLLHQQNPAPGLTLDEIRVATTWAEVTPFGSPALYWDIDGAVAGAGGATPSGVWDAATANWNESAAGDGAAVTWVAGSPAVFSAGGDATGAYTITLSGPQSANAVTFEEGIPTLTGDTLILTGILPGQHTIISNNGVTATIESVIGGSAGFIKDGNGTLVLTADEAYSGATTISGGTLQLGNGATTGSLPTSSAITVNGRLTINQSDDVTQGVEFSGDAITGTGGLTQAGSGTLTLNAANTFNGTTRATAGTLLLANSLALQNSTLDLDGTDIGSVVFDSSLTTATVGALSGSRDLVLENSANAALTLTLGSKTAVYSGGLGGGGSLIKTGSGAQTLSGNNTYTGVTTIDAGSLKFARTLSMSASGDVTVNDGATLAINAGGTDEWTDSTDTSTGGTIGALVAGRGGQGTAGQVTWMPGSTLAIDTTNAPGAPSAPDLTYNGDIGGFRTSGGGTTDEVGFTKQGAGTLTLNGTNTFSGPLAVAPSGGTLVLNGTALNAGASMLIPTVSIGSNSNLSLGASNVLPAGSLITTQTQGRLKLNSFSQTIRSLSGTNGIIEVGTGILTIADQAGDDYTFGIAGGAFLDSETDGKIYKTGEGTLTLMGDAGGNFEGEFILQNGRLNLSRNQALGNSASGKLTVEDGSLGRSTSSSFTYVVGNLDLHVFRYDLSIGPNFNAEFSAGTVTTLKEDDVEFDITNTVAGTGRFNFQGEIRNHDPSPFGGDNPNAIRGITKKGNSVLTLLANNTYKGSTTVEDGVLLISATSSLGDQTLDPTEIGKAVLKGGLLAAADNRAVPVKNRVEVDGNGAIGFYGAGAQTSVVMEFDNNSVVGTSGTLTIKNANTNTSTSSVFRPRFTGSGFDFNLPIVISDAVTVGTGVKTNELQGGNLTDTQTFSGPISGGGSFRRVNAGGITVLSGHNTYSGGTFVEDGTLSAVSDDATFGTGNVTVTGGALTIAAGVDNALHNLATLSLSGGGTPDVADVGYLDLGTGINDVIALLTLGGVDFTSGTYGSSMSLAANLGLSNPDEYFSGTGILTVSAAPATFDGDYNDDGTVDAADYVMWRHRETNASFVLENDATPGDNTADYDQWAANFGNVEGGGSDAQDGNGAVPEPGSLVLLLLAAMSWFGRPRVVSRR